MAFVAGLALGSGRSALRAVAAARRCVAAGGAARPTNFVRMQYAGAGAASFPDKRLQVYVGNVAWSTTEDALVEAFSGAGEISEARIIKDRDTGRSRGFAFVTFVREDSIQKAVDLMNGEELDGRQLRVSAAGDRPPARGRSFDEGNRRSGGGFRDRDGGDSYGMDGGRRGGERRGGFDEDDF